MPYVALRMSGAQSLLGEYKDIIQQASDEYAIEKILNYLEQKVQTLENLAISAYHALGLSGNSVEAIEEELRKKIIDLQSETAALNGINLQESFLKALKEASAFQLDYSKELDALQRHFAQQTGQIVQSSDVATALYNEVGKATKNFFPKKIALNIGEDGKTTNARDIVKGTFTVDLTKPYTELGNKAKTMLNSYLDKNKGLIRSIRKQNEQITNTTFNAQYILDIFGVESLLKMEPKERERVLNQYPELQTKINQHFAEVIISSCHPSRPEYLRASIQEILQKKPLAFFIGGNIEGMTGLLGEIQALYFFKVLLGESSAASVSWIGGINNPHADLLLQKGLQQFGIQVKNSSQDAAEKEVTFQTFGAQKGGEAYSEIYKYQYTDEALKELAKYGSTELIEGISTVLAMEGFNIQYQWDKKTKSAKEVDINPIFNPVREDIEKYSEYAQKIASLFAVSMMYMQEQSFTSGGSNTLYLIGGTTLLSSATILKNIAKQVRGALHNFKISVEGHSATKGKKSGKTIVDVINKKGHLSDTKFILQSSYTFGI